LCYASSAHSASPETSARVGSTGRGSAVCTGALSLKNLSFTQGISRAHPFGRERFSRTHTPSGASERGTQIAIVDWWCCGPFGPSACYGGGVVARRRLVRFSCLRPSGPLIGRMLRTAHRRTQRTPIARPTDRSRGGGAERENVCACGAHRVPHHAADIRAQRRFASQVRLGARRMPDIFE